MKDQPRNPAEWWTPALQCLRELVSRAGVPERPAPGEAAAAQRFAAELALIPHDDAATALALRDPTAAQAFLFLATAMTPLVLSGKLEARGGTPIGKFFYLGTAVEEFAGELQRRAPDQMR